MAQVTAEHRVVYPSATSTSAPLIVETQTPTTTWQRRRQEIVTTIIVLVAATILAVVARDWFTAGAHTQLDLVDWKHDGFPAVQKALYGDFWGAWSGDSWPLMLPFGVLIQTLPTLLFQGQPIPAVALYKLVLLIPMIMIGVSGAVIAGYGARRAKISGWRLQGAHVLGVAMALFNPLVAWTVYAGHPEELAGVALMIFALLNAPRRPIIAGICVGCMVMCKQPFVLAVIPLLFACPRPWRMLLVTVITSAIIILPFVLASPNILQAPVAGATATSVTLYNVWLPVCPNSGISSGTTDLNTVKGFCGHVGSSSHYFIILLGLLLGIIARIRRPPWMDVVPLDRVCAILVTLFLMRSYLDPLNGPYYHLPAFFALLAYLGALKPKLPTKLWLGWLWICLVGLLVAPPLYRAGDAILNGWLVVGYLGIVIPMSVWAAFKALGRHQAPHLV